MYRPSPHGHMAGLALRISLLTNILVVSCLATGPQGKAVSFQYKDYVLTHPLTACGPVPTALDPNGVYPYVSYCETASRPVPQNETEEHSRRHNEQQRMDGR
jgi:hypothetical protein